MTNRTSPPIQFRRSTGHTLIACAAIAVLNLAAVSARAQGEPEVPPAPDSVAAAPATNVDPPSRVARLDYMAGAVTTEPAGASDWSYAQLNRPLTTGDQLWNDQDARSELHIGSSAVRLGPQTSLAVLNLDDSVAQLKVAQGTLSTRVRSLPAGTSYEIDTPNLALGVAGPGDYRVDVAPDGSSTTVTVRSGNVTVYGENGQVPMSAGQQMRFEGTNLQEAASNGLPPPDSFDLWAANRDGAEDRSVSARYVSRDVPGYQDLDANGTWRDDPQYGEVWTPNAVPAGWAPYHDGHWVWQAPWGWTWVDDAPWGFAPYHYGRWANVDNSWAWVPGPMVASAPPVYAPALVAFVGGGDGGFNWGVSLGAGGVAAAGVAWFALGPGEPWHPRWADWSPHYYERVNQTVVINNYRRDVHNTFVNYRVPGAVTAVPATAFVHGQPASRFAQRVDPQQWRNARIESGTPGIAPVKGSFAPGARNAEYRPPATLNQRQVVATRAPGMPGAWHDNLAQRFAHGGGTVPGAGAPVVRTSAPAGATFGGARPGPGGQPVWTAQNVHLVAPHAPGAVPGRGEPARPAQTAMNGAPGRAPMPGYNARNDAPNGQARTPQVEPAAGRPGMPPSMGDARNGVPHPPQYAGRPQEGGQPAPGGEPGRAGQDTGAHQPMWTQPHAPIATRGGPDYGGREAGAPGRGAPQQPSERDATNAPERGQPGRPEVRPGDAQQAPRGGFQQQAGQPPQARGEERPQQPQQQARAEDRPQQPQQQARAEDRPQQPQQQARAEDRPQQPQQQPRAEYRPPQQQQQQPRAEYHPPQQQQQQQPRAEYHPPQQQQQQQPRAEYHPPQQQQQQQQPRAESHPQPQQPQQQPQHQDQRASRAHDDHPHG